MYAVCVCPCIVFFVCLLEGVGSQVVLLLLIGVGGNKHVVCVNSLSFCGWVDRSVFPVVEVADSHEGVQVYALADSLGFVRVGSETSAG